MPNKKKFAKLLTEGITLLALPNSKWKDMGAVKTYLGFQVSVSSYTINAWKSGANFPQNVDVLPVLAKEFVEGCYRKELITPDWVREFLNAGGYGEKTDIEAVIEELFPTHVAQKSIYERLGEVFAATFKFDSSQVEAFVANPKLPEQHQARDIPSLSHEFIGRQDKLTDIMTVLGQAKGPSIIAITGLGGIGKTALAQAVVAQAEKEGRFDDIVWATAKTETLHDGNILIDQKNYNYNFERLLGEIAQQCGQTDIVNEPDMNRKQRAIRGLLRAKQVLIVMDNLESVTDSQQLVRSLSKLLERSKLLITSRHQVSVDLAYNVPLIGLPKSETFNFLHQICRVTEVIESTPQQLNDIFTVTGGAPLAMRLVVPQMNHRPVDLVLKTLKDAKYGDRDEKFYQFIYQQSWELLEISSKMLLVDLSVPEEAIAAEFLQLQTQIREEDIFWAALEQLSAFSLVDNKGSKQQKRYALHALTRYFIKSDITKEWDKANS